MQLFSGTHLIAITLSLLLFVDSRLWQIEPQDGNGRAYVVDSSLFSVSTTLGAVSALASANKGWTWTFTVSQLSARMSQPATGVISAVDALFSQPFVGSGVAFQVIGGGCRPSRDWLIAFT